MPKSVDSLVPELAAAQVWIGSFLQLPFEQLVQDLVDQGSVLRVDILNILIRLKK